jgi:hypothetical protein
VLAGQVVSKHLPSQLCLVLSLLEDHLGIVSKVLCKLYAYVDVTQRH